MQAGPVARSEVDGVLARSESKPTRLNEGASISLAESGLDIGDAWSTSVA